MDRGTDDNVPPYFTMQLMQSLIDANEDFDLVMLPNQRHLGHSSDGW